MENNAIMKMKVLTELEIEENLKTFYEYIDTYITSENKVRGEKLKSFYKSIELVLATSPASSKVTRHNCFAGGYLDHVINVTQAALVFHKVWTKFGQAQDYTLEELVFSAINHDLGKLGTNEEPFYIPNDVQWQLDKGIYYKYNTNIPHMRIADRSLFYLQNAGIPVSAKEFLAIKLHDGLYEEANKSYYMSYNEDYELKSNLPYVLHQADLMSSKIETQK